MVIIREYRVPLDGYEYGFPAGLVDNGESLEQAARRELMEETGLRVGELISMGGYVDNGNQGGSTGHYFAAMNCARICDPAPGDLEEFSYQELSPEDITAAMKTGEFSVIHHVAAWGLWLMHNGGGEDVG